VIGTGQKVLGTAWGNTLVGFSAEMGQKAGSIQAQECRRNCELNRIDKEEIDGLLVSTATKHGERERDWVGPKRRIGALYDLCGRNLYYVYI